MRHDEKQKELEIKTFGKHLRFQHWGLINYVVMPKSLEKSRGTTCF
jgi:hypothetical protein